MMIFVVGSGRCGSCWSGRILDGHPEIRCTIEKAPQFHIAATLALWPSRLPELWPELLEAYASELRTHPELHYADKTHPLIWQWERLSNEYPEAWFWVMRRGAERTVSSMLKHGAIRERFERSWSTAEFPSRSLGVGPGREKEYSGMHLIERAAWKWAAHNCECERLLRLHPRSFEVRYEELVQNGDALLESVRQKLGLREPFPNHGPRSTSLGPVLRPFERELMQRAVARFEPWWS